MNEALQRLRELDAAAREDAVTDIRATIRVYGDPRAKGSKVAVISRGTGRAITKESGTKASRERLVRWTTAVTDTVAEYANTHPGPWPIVGAPIKATLRFYLPRPKAHYSARGGVKDSFSVAPHLIKPDVDKLVRAVLDCCTGILWQDDTLVTDCRIVKRYVHTDELPGLTIEIEAPRYAQ